MVCAVKGKIGGGKREWSEYSKQSTVSASES